jgi:hypothetical protein
VTLSLYDGSQAALLNPKKEEKIMAYTVPAAGNIGQQTYTVTNAGSVTVNEFNQAMVAIGATTGPPYNTVYIAYAHPNNTDPGYQSTIADFVTWGVPTSNIIEITNVFLPMFGLNNLLQAGY